jgi:hypothetical protein
MGRPGERKGLAAEEESEELVDSILLGMRKETINKKRKKAEKEDEKKRMLPVDLEGKMRGVRCVCARSNFASPCDVLSKSWGAEEWLGLLAGELEFCGNGVVKGVSEFGSLCALGVSLSSGKWYYEVHLLTSGLMQVSPPPRCHDSLMVVCGDSLLNGA